MKTNYLKRLIPTLLVTALALVAAPNQETSPVGRWKTIDDKTSTTRSIVRIFENDGLYFAAVEQNLRPGEENKVCSRCTGDRNNQPLIGLVFMRNVRLIDGEYRDGEILDPDSGTIYRCKMRLEDNGRKLRVRGFVGVSLFGRSQVWERMQ